MDYSIMDLTPEILQKNNPDLYKRVQEGIDNGALQEKLEAMTTKTQKLSESVDSLTTKNTELTTECDKLKKENDDLKKKNWRNIENPVMFC